MEVLGKIILRIFLGLIIGFAVGAIIAFWILTKATILVIISCLVGGSIAGVMVACFSVRSLVEKNAG
ncbi:MAG: hypothetical protein Q8P20_08455 [bacterium]|nr:hypothetical protein [bacterium]